MKIGCLHMEFQIVTEKPFYMDKGKKYLLPEKVYMVCEGCKEQLNINRITQRTIDKEVPKKVYG